MTTPVRPVFFLERRMLPLLWVFIAAAVVLALLVVAGRVSIREKAQPAAAVPHDDGQRVSEHRSADGRTVCYTVTHYSAVSMSCFPAWLLDRPNNWLVAYPPAVAKRPATKQPRGNSKESAK